MKTAILGSGYLGTALAISLKENGHTVTLSTRNPSKIPLLAPMAAQVISIRDSLEPFLEGQENLIVTVAPAAGESYTQTYLETAHTLFKLLPKFPTIKRVLYTGSTSVYGEHGGKWVDEETPPSPLTPNAQILLDTEQVYLKIDRQISILRLGELYGPGRELSKRLQGAEGKIFPGTGENYTNLIHVDDCISVINFLLNSSFSGIYNLCSPHHISRKSLYEYLCKRNNLPIPLWDKQKANFHGGNKRVFCGKLNLSGYITPFHNPFI